MASLFVIQGADQGKRFVLASSPSALGRDPSNPIRLHDHEVSRRHAELRSAEDRSYRVVDLGSANGTYVNEQPISESAQLRSGDRLRVGQTVMLYSEGPGAGRGELTQRVDLLSRASSEDRSAIIRSLPAGEGSQVFAGAGGAGEWLRVRLANLGVLYQATQAISHIGDLDELLGRILELVFESIGADRGAILMAGDSGTLEPHAVRWRAEEEADPDERVTISRTIIDHVRETGQAVITSDAPTDQRFGPSQSIVDFAIREAMCVPLVGRHTTLGVLYADTRALGELTRDASGEVVPRSRFTQEHLMLMAAIGHQAGLAIENTQLHQAKIQAERLAAVGQTIATLSHHIKNILQGLRGGSYLIDMGLREQDDAIVRRGWSIVEKNQGKIYNLVMDMLSFSKDREPALEPADLNETVADVVELMQSRASELGVGLDWRPGEGLPEVQIDPEGIHRVVLNVLTNAIDASEGVEGGRVAVSTDWDEESGTARVTVSDQGVGIEPEAIGSIFELFASSKGSRGTGLGLPVTRKIVREHGGEIRVTSAPGSGSKFVIELPQRRGEAREPDTPFETIS